MAIFCERGLKPRRRHAMPARNLTLLVAGFSKRCASVSFVFRRLALISLVQAVVFLKEKSVRVSRSSVAIFKRSFHCRKVCSHGFDVCWRFSKVVWRFPKVALQFPKVPRHFSKVPRFPFDRSARPRAAGITPLMRHSWTHTPRLKLLCAQKVVILQMTPKGSLISRGEQER